MTDPGDSGPNTLRGIMAIADSNGQDDTITFQAGITAINLTTGQIRLITQNNLLTIDGGVAGVTINGAATASSSNRIFNFNISGGNPTISLKSLTLANGFVSGSSFNGGAILLNNDPLTLENVTFNNNKATNGGAAIATTSGVAATISIINCAITNNSAAFGGAIFGQGVLKLNMTGTTVSGNTSTYTGGFLQTNGPTIATFDSVSFTNNISATTLATGSGVIHATGNSSTWGITNCTFANNTASVGMAGVMTGGGSSSKYDISRCVFTNNLAGNGPGGALRFTGNSTSVSIDSCTLSGNTANSTAAGGMGGAIDFYPSGGVGSLSIKNSTISGNSAQGNGGGMSIRTSGTGSAVITNSTITGNVVTSPGSDGGGLAFGMSSSSSTGSLTINNCTISGNSAGLSTGSGGGIRKLQATNSGTITINSSIVAGNSAAAGPDFFSDSTIPFNIGGGHNVFGVADQSGVTFSGANRTGTLASPLDAKLNPLANNGGPTHTQSLQNTSPAINFGTNGLSLASDQRGLSFPRVNGKVPDVGAFESATVIPEATASLPSVTPAATTYVATVVYTDETGIDTSTIDVNDVVLTGPGYVGSASPTIASFTGSGTSVTATYTFAAPVGAWEWTDNGQYTLTMQSGQVSDTDGPNAVAAGTLEVLLVSIPLPNPLVVDNSGDIDDGNYSSNQLTLREAIRVSNVTSGQTESITFAAALSGQTISIGSLIFITDAVSITGWGAANLTLSGGNTNQLFGIALADGNGTVNMNQLTIANGNATAGMGGAIAVDTGHLTLSSVTLDSNKSTASTLAGGGAILFNAAAKLTLNNCTITKNVVMGSSIVSLSGGAVVNANAAASTVTFNGCLISSNSSGLANGGVIRGSTTGLNLVISDSTITGNTGNTGGVGYMGIGSVVTVVRSTMTGNVATSPGVADGGGVFNFFTSNGGTFIAESSLFANNTGGAGGAVAYSGGSFTFTNCTLDANTATGNGGGAIYAGGGTTVLNNCTVTGNVATAGDGGGIKKISISGSVELASTIVATNASAFGGPDISCSTGTPTYILGGANLVGVADLGNFTLAGTVRTGTAASPFDPMLFPLADNGGPTKTRALKVGSPAFNSGLNSSSLIYDQRGIGFPRTQQVHPDIGAFEGFNPVPAYSATLTDVPPINANYKASVTYTSPVGIDTGSIDVNDVRLSGGGFGDNAVSPISATVTAGSYGAQSVTVEYVFTPPGGSWDYTDDGTYQLNVMGVQVFDTNANSQAAPAGNAGSFLVAIPLPVLVVDNSGDVDDSNYSAGQFTLREAINRANAAVGTSDTITFAPSLNGQKIYLTSLASLDITDPLTIAGPGASNLTVSGSDFTRVFYANIPTIGSSISISGLTIADGNKTGGSGLWITNENATVSDCVFYKNYNNAAGGAIYVNNTAATLTVNNCTFDSNTSGGGGAITVAAGSRLLVNNSLFVNNVTSAGNTGGAIRYIGTPTATNATIRNSTFTGNTTEYDGGALGFTSINAPVLVQNCTIINNIADYDDTGDGQGGGIAIFGAGINGKVILDSCIVSGNVRGFNAPVADDLKISAGGQFAANFSLIGNTTNAAAFVADAKTTSLLGQNPMLDVLANNGGPTKTMKPLAGSPAIDNGSNPAALTFDQRGTGFYRVSGTAADIGAFEVQPAVATPAKVAATTINGGQSQRSRVTTVSVQFDSHVTFVSLPASAFTLVRQGNNAAVALAATVNDTGPGTLVTLTIIGGAADGPAGNYSLVDGRYTLTVLADQIAGAGFDGNGNGVANGSPADDYVLASAAAPSSPTNIFRIFGDSNGNGLVDGTDFLAFRLAFLSNSPTFDFDGNGIVDSGDFLQFRLHFLASV